MPVFSSEKERLTLYHSKLIWIKGAFFASSQRTITYFIDSLNVIQLPKAVKFLNKDQLNRLFLDLPIKPCD